MQPERGGAVAGIVLAAGASTRMGKNKLLLLLDGESALKKAVRRALSSGLDPVIVVLGHEADRALRELSGLPCLPIRNPDYASGIHSSLRTGIAAVPARARAAAVLLADMPFVTEGMIATLIERYRQSSAPLVLSDYAGVQAPPTLYDRSLFAELLAAEVPGCSKRIVKRHAGEAVSVAWPEAALTDLDRPEDYDRVRAELSGGETPCAPIC
jgi:molybdenum cofactor cytidylyltransferase